MRFLVTLLVLLAACVDAPPKPTPAADPTPTADAGSNQPIDAGDGGIRRRGHIR